MTNFFSRHKYKCYGPHICYCGLVFNSNQQFQKHKLRHNIGWLHQVGLITRLGGEVPANMDTTIRGPLDTSSNTKLIENFVFKSLIFKNSILGLPTLVSSESNSEIERLEPIIRDDPVTSRLLDDSSRQRPCPICNEMIGFFKLKGHIKKTHKLLMSRG